MPKSKKPRHHRRRKAILAGRFRTEQYLNRAFPWDAERKDALVFDYLEPICAIMHGDLRKEQWQRAKAMLCLAYYLAAHTDQRDELMRDIERANRLFQHAFDAHSARHELLISNLEAVRVALKDALDVAYAFEPGEVIAGYKKITYLPDERRRWEDALDATILPPGSAQTMEAIR